MLSTDCLADMELLGEGRFDAAVLNMVLMDMPDIAAVAGGLRHILKARVTCSHQDVHVSSPDGTGIWTPILAGLCLILGSILKHRMWLSIRDVCAAEWHRRCCHITPMLQPNEHEPDGGALCGAAWWGATGVPQDPEIPERGYQHMLCGLQPGDAWLPDPAACATENPAAALLHAHVMVPPLAHAARAAALLPPPLERTFHSLL